MEENLGVFAWLAERQSEEGAWDRAGKVSWRWAREAPETEPGKPLTLQEWQGRHGCVLRHSSCLEMENKGRREAPETVALV